MTGHRAPVACERDGGIRHDERVVHHAQANARGRARSGVQPTAGVRHPDDCPARVGHRVHARGDGGDAARRRHGIAALPHGGGLADVQLRERGGGDRHDEIERVGGYDLNQRPA